jgi:maltooligosyltrehalose trehalohydrolase
VLDPQDEATFLLARLNHGLRGQGQHKVLRNFYRELIRIRKENAALACLSKDNMEVMGDEESKTLCVRRWQGDSEVAIIYNLDDKETAATPSLPGGRWQKLLDSAEEKWQGSGSMVAGQLRSDGKIALTISPRAFILLEKEN